MLPLLISAGATFDATKKYRYVLWRNFVVEPSDPCLWVMLNPSTATGEEDDQTVRKCQNFSRLWGHDSCRVVNIFAWRSTDPKVLPRIQDPVGPDNDRYILEEAAKASRIICAWGNWGWVCDRGKAVRKLLEHKQCWCFAITQSGQPNHPLYMPMTSPLIPYR